MNLFESLKREFSRYRSGFKLHSQLLATMAVVCGVLISHAALDAADVMSSRSISGFVITGCATLGSLSLCLFIARVWEGRHAIDVSDDRNER